MYIALFSLAACTLALAGGLYAYCGFLHQLRTVGVDSYEMALGWLVGIALIGFSICWLICFFAVIDAALIHALSLSLKASLL